jgi:hypothetical protein
MSEAVDCVVMNSNMQLDSCSIKATKMYVRESTKLSSHLNTLKIYLEKANEDSKVPVHLPYIEEVSTFYKSLVQQYPSMSIYGGMIAVVIAALKMQLNNKNSNNNCIHDELEVEILKMLLISIVLILHTPHHLRVFQLSVPSKGEQLLILQKKCLEKFSEHVTSIIFSDTLVTLSGRVPLLHDLLDGKYLLFISRLLFQSDKVSIVEALGLNSNCSSLISHLWKFAISGSKVADEKWDCIPKDPLWKTVATLTEVDEPAPKPVGSSSPSHFNSFYEYLR